MELAGGADVSLDHGSLAKAMEAVARWADRRVAAEISGAETGAVARARRRVLARITRVVARAPRHMRPTVSALAAEARCAALVALSEGAERVLADLADAPLADHAWLRALAAFGELHGRRRSTAANRGASGAPAIVALLLLDSRARAET
jgi:hypothetical protein